MTINILGADLQGFAKVPQGAGAHAEGFGTVALGTAAHAEGSGTFATANYAHAEGVGTVASAVGAHAEGNASNATAAYAHAEGSQTSASGIYSHAEGVGAQAYGYGQWARSTFLGSSIGGYRCQSGIYTMGTSTSFTSPVSLTFDGSGTPSVTTPGNNILLVSTRGVVTFNILVSARKAGATQFSQGWQITGAAYNDSGTAGFLPTPTVTTWSVGTSFGAPSMGTYGGNGLVVNVSPNTTSTIVWFAVMYTSEMSTTT